MKEEVCNVTPVEVVDNIEEHREGSNKMQYFAAEKKDNESLRDPWQHKREGSHGMSVIGGLLYHFAQADRGVCK